MKLYSTVLPAMALAAREAPRTQEKEMRKLMRTTGTYSPHAADFTSPVAAVGSLYHLNSDVKTLSYNPGQHGNCMYLKGYPTWYEGYSNDCDDTPFRAYGTHGHGVPCEWRGTDPSTIPTAVGTYNGWHCNTGNTVCFAMIVASVDWWAALELCESTFSMKLAAPKDVSEAKLIVDNYDQYDTRVWHAAFWDDMDNIWYWAHDSPQTAPAVSWVTDDSKAVHTFDDSDFLEQVSQEVPTEILENMLADHGLTQSGGARRKREAATNFDTISALIERNGCWCPYALAAGDHFPGAPLNDYDTACRKLSHCVSTATTCTSGACFSGNDNEGFQYAIDVADLTKGFSCRATNACDTAVCMCQVQFAVDVFELVDAAGNTMTISDTHLDLVAGNTQCVASAGAGASSGSC